MRVSPRTLFASGLLAVLLVAGPAGAETYVIQAGDTPAQVAERFKIPVDELLRFNGLGPRGPFKVGQTLDIPRAGQVGGDSYVVQNGDSLARVADHFGVSQEALREANDLKPTENLKVGETIAIPHELRGGASHSHVVRKGDTLASIAKRFQVKPTALARANKLGKGQPLQLGRTLVIPDDDVGEGGGEGGGGGAGAAHGASQGLVKSGEKVREGVRHTVQPGQTVKIIAEAYNVPAAKILKANRLKSAREVKVGAEILVPGAREVVPVRVKGYSVQPVHFVRVWNNADAKLRLVDNKGRVNAASRKALSRLAGPRKKGQGLKLFHPRLVSLMQRVAERWPGQTIEVISGYRPRVRGGEVSNHTRGRAIDFRVRGVANRELFDFLKELPQVGVGYYPNSVFIHLDVRDRATTWIDYAKPGERARYRKPTGPAPPDAEAGGEDAVESAADNEEEGE